MKSIRIFLSALTVLCAAEGVVLADDIFPPAWRGGINSTFQSWDFTTSPLSDNNTLPIVLSNQVPNSVTNQYGSPVLGLDCGNFGGGWFDNTAGEYAFFWGSKQGFWDIGDGSMTISVPNFASTHTKLVQFQITYYAGSTYQVPVVSLSPTATLVGSPVTNLLFTSPEGESWFTAKYTWQLSASPTNEVINITGGSSFGSIIDQVILDTQVSNNVPVITAYAVNRTAGLGLKIFWSDLTNHWSDADGDVLRLASFNLSSTNGVNVSTNASFILYPPTAAGVNDQIAYQVTDNQGSTINGVINIVVNTSVTVTNSIISIASGNPTSISASGIPGFTYITERSTNLVSWTSIATNTASGSGAISVSDSFADLGHIAPVAAYYRLKWSGN